MDIYDMFMRIPPFSWENRPCFAQLRALAEILLIEHRHLLGSDWHLWHFGGSPTVPTVPTIHDFDPGSSSLKLILQR